MEDRPAPPPASHRQADLAFAGTVVLLLLAWALLYRTFPAVGMLLFLGGILSYALLPLVDWLHGRGVQRTLAVVAVALGGAGLIVLVAVLLAPVVAAQLAELPQMVARTWEDLQRLWPGLRDRLPGPIGQEVERFGGSIEQVIRDALPAPGTVADWASRAAGAIGTVATGLLFVPVFVFLMLRSYHRFLGRLTGLVPPRWQDRFLLRTGQADEVLSGFVRGQLLVATIMGAIYAVAFTIVGVPLALVVGIIAGIGELVPFLGGAIALVLASILALAAGQPLDVLWVLVAFTVAQTLESVLISPWIMGSKVELGPGVVIVAIVVGGELLGFIGLLAAVPAAALLKVAGRSAIDAYRSSPFYLRRRAA